MTSQDVAKIHAVSIVVPVFQGELTLEPLIAELEPLTAPRSTPNSARFRITEVMLVHDGAADKSDAVMQMLAAKHRFITPIWLSRNFGQHPATLAGMASTSGDWAVTIDEDGQQDPRDIARLLDVALETEAQLVYAEPTNAPPHGWIRNSLSAVAKWIFARALGHSHLGEFNSFRLIDGEIARGMAAFCGSGVYLDVALSWIVGNAAHCPVELRRERGRPSAYSYRKLAHHFWRLVLTSGTRPLRLVAFIGISSVLLGIAVSVYALWGRLSGRAEVPGWASLLIVVSLFSGLTLFSLGVLAEYLGIAITMALGKPLYLITSRPNRSKPRHS